MKPLSAETARMRAETRCASRECCLYDIREALRRWGVENSESREILEYLEQEGYIDEARYACAYAHDKAHYDRWGRLKIQAALRMKGISDSDIRQGLNRIPDAVFHANLRAVLEAKRRVLHEDDPRKIQEKLARYAISRGYEPRLVFELLEGT